MTKLQERLVARAEELGISQTELAERTGALQQSISALFGGEVEFPTKWAEIARELQIPETEMVALMMQTAEATKKTKRIPRDIRQKYEELTRPTGHIETSPNARVARDIAVPTPSRAGKMIPVYGQAVGGVDGRYIFNGSVLDYAICPPSLEGVPNAYAVYIDGESMSPRYKPGETVWVHPYKPARRGDDVIVQVRPNDESEPPYGFVKELIGWAGDRLVLKQHNPSGELSFNRIDVVSVHPIVFSGKY